jgi:hypothetical protein
MRPADVRRHGGVAHFMLRSDETANERQCSLGNFARLSDQEADEMVLALLEHWFPMLPLPVERLWRWCLKAGQEKSGGDTGKLLSFKAFEAAWAG